MPKFRDVQSVVSSVEILGKAPLVAQGSQALIVSLPEWGLLSPVPEDSLAQLLLERSQNSSGTGGFM